MKMKDITNSISDFLFENDSLIEASNHMKTNRIRSLPVVNKNKKLVGLITHREIINGILSGKSELIVKDSMIEPISATPNLSIKAAVEIMVNNRFGCLPVVDFENTLVGFTTEIDFLNPLLTLAKNSKDNLKLKASDVMNRKTKVLWGWDKVLNISGSMKEDKIRSLPVVNILGNLEGLITLREVIDAVISGDKQITVKDAMLKTKKKQVISIKPEDSLEEAIEIMTKNKFSSLPVVGAFNMLQGMIIEKDIFQSLNEIAKFPEDFYSERFGNT